MGGGGGNSLRLGNLENPSAEKYQKIWTKIEKNKCFGASKMYQGSEALKEE